MKTKDIKAGMLVELYGAQHIGIVTENNGDTFEIAIVGEPHSHTINSWFLNVVWDVNLPISDKINFNNTMFDDYTFVERTFEENEEFVDYCEAIA